MRKIRSTFMPSPGVIRKMEWNDSAHVRIDIGYEEGGSVTPFYDPMIAKVIVHADGRQEAISIAEEFFSSFIIEGVKSNIPLFEKFLGSKEFENGNYTTNVLAEWLKKEKEEMTK